MTIQDTSLRTKLLATVIIGITLGYFEAAVVVYIRELFYPVGFSFPLKIIPMRLLIMEVCREAVSILLIIAISVLAAQRFRDRFGYFLIIFGTWDIFYYVWLKAVIGWPSSLLDWDILFLIPLPWIAPVIAPLLVASLMVGIGLAVVVISAGQQRFHSPLFTTVLALAGTAAILYSFMYDIAASLHQQVPQDYKYGLLVAGLILYLVAFRVARFASSSRLGTED